jgi:hypothetical protein
MAGTKPGHDDVRFSGDSSASSRKQKWPREGAIFVCCDRDQLVLWLVRGCCDFHCAMLSAMIFIDVMAAWLSDA